MLLWMTWLCWTLCIWRNVCVHGNGRSMFYFVHMKIVSTGDNVDKRDDDDDGAKQSQTISRWYIFRFIIIYHNSHGIHTSNILCARRNHKTHTPCTCTRNASGAQRALLEPPAVAATAVTAAAIHNVQCHRLLWDVIYVMSIYYYCVCGVHVHCTSTYPSGERKRQQQQQQWASRKDNAGMVFSWKSNRFPSTNSIEQGAGPQLRCNMKCRKVDAIYVLCTS